jgi:hypothetical protein
MSKTTKKQARPTARVTAQEQARINARNALHRAVRREREIQRLARAFKREVQKSNDELQVLGAAIARRASGVPQWGAPDVAVNE